MKIDPYNHKERYLKWKNNLEEGIIGISKENSEIIINYVFDMENGINISSTSAKGRRSYIRLNNIRQRLVFLAKELEKRKNITNITTLTDKEIIYFFNEMRDGTIKRKDGKEYTSPIDYIKPFISFWHWHQKVQRKKGKEIEDITTDIDTSKTKPKWVYLTEEQIKKITDNVKYEYKVLITFLLDSGIRSPTELINIKVSDLQENCKELEIREEISKTFGRKIKLLLAPELLQNYIKTKKLQPQERLFNITPTTVNKYLKRTGKKLFGEKTSPAGKKYSELTMYHFRHNSACYWAPRYKSEAALKYRFGWKKSDKIHYYTEFLGMKDTISEEDLLIDTTKTELEQRLTKTEKEKHILENRLEVVEKQLRLILSQVKGLGMEIDDANLKIA